MSPLPILPHAAERESYDATIRRWASGTGDLVFQKLAGPDWLHLAPDGALSGVPQRPDVGTGSFRVKVTDPLGQSSEIGFPVLVEKRNRAPQWTRDEIELPDAVEGAIFHDDLSALAQDPDGDRLSFNKLKGPAWLAVAPNGMVSGVPDAESVGKFRAEIAASDGEKAVPIDVHGVVKMKNYPPEFAAQPLSLRVKERETLEENLNRSAFVHDRNDDKLTFSLVHPEPWLSLTGDGVLTAKPGFTEIGRHAIRVKVSDGQLAPETGITLEVTRNPRPPVLARELPRLEAKARVPFTADLAGLARDLDGVKILYRKKSGPSWLAVAPDGKISGTPPDSEVGRDSLTVAVDNDLETLPIELPIHVLFNNHPPEWKPLSLPSAPERSPFDASLAPFARDPDGDPLKFEKISGPSWLVVSPDGHLTGTPQRPDVGTSSFKLKVSDPSGLSAETAASILVEKRNRPPHWKSETLQLADSMEDHPFSADLNPLVEDADGDRLTFSKLDGPLWLTVAPNGKVAGNPQDQDLGPFKARFDAFDGEAHTPVDARGQIVLKPYPPVFQQPSLAFTFKEREVFQENLNQKKYVTDRNDDPLKFQLLNPPPWITLAPDGALVAKPGFHEVGDHALRVRVTDGTFNADTNLTLTVLRDPRPPLWKNEAITFEARAREPFAGDVASRATDQDGLPFTFSKKAGPEWLTVSPTGHLEGIPPDSAVGDNRITLAATNDQRTAEKAVTVHVLFKNHPPVANDSKLQFQLREREELVRNLAQKPYVEDPDPQDTLTFTLDGQSPDWLRLARDGTLTLRPRLKDVGDFQFLFHVTDGTDITVGTLHVSVARWPRPPEWKDDSLELSLKAQHPLALSLRDKVVDHDGLPIRFEKVSGPDWAQVSADGELTGTPQDSDVGTAKVRIAARNDVLTAEKTVAIHVLFNRKAPFFTGGTLSLPRGRADEDYQVYIGKYAVDPDPPHTLTFVKLQGPEWIQVTPDGILGGLPEARDAGSFLVRVRAINSDNLAAECSFRIDVSPKNSPPRVLHNPVELPDAAPGQLMLYDTKFAVEDPDGDKLTFSKIRGPAWISVAGTGEITGVPDEPGGYPYEVDVDVTDGRAHVSFTAKGTVKGSAVVPR